MDKFLKISAYIIAAIAIAFIALGYASFFLPETSNLSILWNKLGRNMTPTLLLTGLSLAVAYDSRKRKKSSLQEGL